MSRRAQPEEVRRAKKRAREAHRLADPIKRAAKVSQAREYSQRPEVAAKRRAYQKQWRAVRGPDVKRAYYARPEVRERYRRYGWRRNGIYPTRPRPPNCECCGGITYKAMNADHCHRTGAFRGWLCSTCNSGLGMLGDDAHGLRRMLDYLVRTGADLL